MTNPVVIEAANCLRDDPSFRLLTSLEEQRAEARLILAAIPGGDPDLADEVILETLNDAGEDGGESVTVEVSKPDFANGVWTPRKIQVAVPKRNRVGRPTKAEALERAAYTPEVIKSSDQFHLKALEQMGREERLASPRLDQVDLSEIPVPRIPRKVIIKEPTKAEMMEVARERRRQLRKERAARAARRWAPREGEGVAETKRVTLISIKAALGLSQAALATVLGVSRSTIDAVIDARMEWHPTVDQMKKLHKLMLNHKRLMEETLVEIERVLEITT